MPEIAWPEAHHVASRLEEIRREVCEACDCERDEDGDVIDHDDDGCAARVDVRLQVYPPDLGGRWAVRWGLSDYDQDHRGYWGCSSVELSDDPASLEETARDLLSQAQEQEAIDG